MPLPRYMTLSPGYNNAQSFSHSTFAHVLFSKIQISWEQGHLINDMKQEILLLITIQEQVLVKMSTFNIEQ